MCHSERKDWRTDDVGGCGNLIKLLEVLVLLFSISNHPAKGKLIVSVKHGPGGLLSAAPEPPLSAKPPVGNALGVCSRGHPVANMGAQHYFISNAFDSCQFLGNSKLCRITNRAGNYTGRRWLALYSNSIFAFMFFFG